VTATAGPASRTRLERVRTAAGRSDWQLACAALEVRRSARRSDDPQAETDRQMKKNFTAGEAARIDAFFEAARHDTDRLAAIEARLDESTGDSDDTAWLIEQLRLQWALMDELRDRIDDAGSTMRTSYVESAIGYVRWSRKPA
jgi:hypothetical protein